MLGLNSVQNALERGGGLENNVKMLFFGALNYKKNFIDGDYFTFLSYICTSKARISR
jgi:hypothetical protein